MDPVSAFQLAAAVIGVVDFGARLLSDTYEIYQSGTGHRARDVELSTLSQDLSRLSAQVQNRIPAASAPPTGPEAVLSDVAQQCIDASARLQKAVNDLQANMTGTSKISIAANSFVSALKAVWKKSEIEALKENLANIRSQMTIATLVSVWGETRQSGQRHTDLTGRLDEIAKKLDRHDEPARKFAKELMEMTVQENVAHLSRKNADLIKILWEIDWTSWDVSHNGRLFTFPKSADQPNAGDVPVTMKILGSLSFSEMKTRKEAIPEAYAATFEWIFRDEQTDENGKALEWPSFPEWLKDPVDSLYWITGKPGSGKSTLMKYIFEHQQLRLYLKHHAGDLPLMLAGFFFWNPGSKMQKSYEGLLRTLLYQCLLAREDLIPAVAPRRWALYNLLGGETVAPEWTWRELKESFDALCSYHGKEFRLVLFVDGLDEFEGAESDPTLLLNWIKDTIKLHDIKFCVSSRPWNVFSDAFRKDRSLMMQDLTRRDIEHFVRTEFDNSSAFQELKGVFPDDANRLINNIIEKAEGVFLWVSLIVRSLLSILTDTPSLPILEEKLAEVPSDIMGMYKAIWHSIPRDRLATTSKLFQLCRVQDVETTAATFWLANEGPAARKRAPMDEAAREGIGKVLKRLLDGHTRGICELASNKVQFLHRSAHDWMAENAMWADILAKAPADFEPNWELLEAFLAQASTDMAKRDNIGEGGIANCVLMCFEYAWQALESGKAVSDDRMVKALDGVNRLACDLAHSGRKRHRVYHDVTVSSKSPNPEGFSSTNWLAIQMPDENINVESSFVGIAARAGFVAYVKAKVKADKKGLLNPKTRRVSLLERAIFPGLQAVEKHVGQTPYTFFPSDAKEERLEIIRFLLDTADTQFETAYGDSMYDVCEAQRKLGDSEWYAQVLRLLKKHGYRPSQSGTAGDGDKQQGPAAQKESRGRLFGLRKANGTEKQEKPEKQPGILKRLVAKLF